MVAVLLGLAAAGVGYYSLSAIAARAASGSSAQYRDVVVTAAGQKTAQGESKPLSVQAVTLLVDPQGAEMLAHAQHQGVISLILRNPDDQSKAEVATFSTREMMGNAEPPARHWTARAPASTP